MASDISRLIFNKNKQYSAVRMQQGRVLLDSDWNVQHDINQYRLHTQTVDVIGKSGVPKDTDGFKVVQNGNKLTIKPGRIYVNGLLCELNQAAEISSHNPPEQLAGDEFSPPHATVFSNLKDGAHIIYLDSWQRGINYLQDPEIQEKALGEADTTTRLQNVWSINSLAVKDDLTCDGESNKWDQLILPPNGTLEAKTIGSNESEDPCEPEQSQGYRRLENQLYRVEIHKGGDLSNSTFKWSRDNASVEVNIKSSKGDHVLIVNSLGKDDVLGFQIGDWVEIIDHSVSFARGTHGLMQIEDIDPNTLEITVDANISGITISKDSILRRWDQPATSQAAGIALKNTFLPLEDGIKVKFSAGTYRTGDYWLIPARSISSSIEWPSGVKKLPMGVKNAYCKLAIVKVSGGSIIGVEDCRPTFPSLTDLCEPGGKCCTYHVKPESGWESVFDKIGQNEDAMICFEVGRYKLENTKNINDKGNLKLVGAGPGTSIEASGLQVALKFSNCKYVSISDLAATTGKVVNQDKNDKVSLKGTFSFFETGNVYIDKVRIKCGHGMRPQASCINVFNSKAKPGIVNLENSIFNVGYYQHGIIIINSDRAVVQNNIISAYKKPDRHKFFSRFKDPRFRKIIKRMMASNISPKSNPKTNITLTYGRTSISFKTDPELKAGKVWERQIESDKPAGIRKKEDLIKYIEEKTTSLMSDPEALLKSAFKSFFIGLSRQDPSLAYQGITIAGTKASDVHILRNKIDNVLQGIHTGLSHSTIRSIHDIIKSVKIEKNTIRNVLSPVTSFGRHGIFVGNCSSLMIDDNEIELLRLPGTEKIKTDGIRVWGKLGDKLIVSNNHIYGSNGQSKAYNIGIRINPINEIAKNTKWAVTWNVAPSINKTYSVPNSVTLMHASTNSP